MFSLGTCFSQVPINCLLPQPQLFLHFYATASYTAERDEKKIGKTLCRFLPFLAVPTAQSESADDVTSDNCVLINSSCRILFRSRPTPEYFHQKSDISCVSNGILKRAAVLVKILAFPRFGVRVMKMCTKGERNEREETEKHWGKLFLVDMETERKEEIYVQQEKPVNMPSEELSRETTEWNNFDDYSIEILTLA